MALTRRSGNRFQANIWPGFVDAMTALLLVLFFVLTIFMIVQFVLRETITTQDTELEEFSAQIAELADALGLEQQANFRLETRIDDLDTNLTEAEARVLQQAALIATLNEERDTANTQIADFEDQVASLLARNRDLDASLIASRATLAEVQSESAALQDDLDAQQTAAASLQESLDREIGEKEALQLALAQARSEIDEGVEAARLAAARREALQAMIADLEAKNATANSSLEEREAELAERERLLNARLAELDQTSEALSEAEQARLVEAAAAEALRARLAESTAELTAMTLNLEAERKRAEDTLTLLAAAEARRDELENLSVEGLSEADRQRALLEIANQALEGEQAISAEAQREVALLNQQSTELRNELNALQGLLDAAQDRDSEAQIQIEALGQNLNQALAQVAAEERRRADLEARERARLEEEAKDLENYRSEFFGRVREIIGEREGIQVVGDRFVFSSEVLFARGSANLGPEGRVQLAQVASVIREIAPEIPREINWILRIDGHTDNIPLSGGAAFRDNWELSQARALSVVRYLIDFEGLPAGRLAANGFGEFQPVDLGSSPEALARNRRIELKFTER